MSSKLLVKTNLKILEAETAGRKWMKEQNWKKEKSNYWMRIEEKVDDEEKWETDIKKEKSEVARKEKSMRKRENKSKEKREGER